MVALIRIKDIAERAGVSTTTVSNVIHHKEGKVSPELAARINEMIREMGYVPSLSARMLAKEDSHVIGVVVACDQEESLRTRKNLLAASLVRYLGENIREKGYYMMLFTQCSVEHILQETRAWNFDGLIAFGVSQEELEQLQASFSKPVVTIDYEQEEDCANLCRVGTDNFGGGRQIGAYLLGQGHRKLRFVAVGESQECRQRWLGFRQAMEEGGIPQPDEMRICVSSDQQTRLGQYDALLPLLREQTALCFCSDFHAVEAMNHLRERGLRLPEDLSVAGFDDVVYAWAAWPRLTTVHQSIDEKARLAVELLTRLVAGSDVENRNQRVPTYVVEGQSVRLLRQN